MGIICPFVYFVSFPYGHVSGKPGNNCSNETKINAATRYYTHVCIMFHAPLQYISHWRRPVYWRINEERRFHKKPCANQAEHFQRERQKGRKRKNKLHMTLQMTGNKTWQGAETFPQKKNKKHFMPFFLSSVLLVSPNFAILSFLSFFYWKNFSSSSFPHLIGLLYHDPFVRAMSYSHFT